MNLDLRKRLYLTLGLVCGLFYLHTWVQGESTSSSIVAKAKAPLSSAAGTLPTQSASAIQATPTPTPAPTAASTPDPYVPPTPIPIPKHLKPILGGVNLEDFKQASEYAGSWQKVLEQMASDILNQRQSAFVPWLMNTPGQLKSPQWVEIESVSYYEQRLLALVQMSHYPLLRQGFLSLSPKDAYSLNTDTEGQLNRWARAALGTLMPDAFLPDYLKSAYLLQDKDSILRDQLFWQLRKSQLSLVQKTPFWKELKTQHTPLSQLPCATSMKLAGNPVKKACRPSSWAFRTPVNFQKLAATWPGGGYSKNEREQLAKSCEKKEFAWSNLCPLGLKFAQGESLASIDLYQKLITEKQIVSKDIRNTGEYTVFDELIGAYPDRRFLDSVVQDLNAPLHYGDDMQRSLYVLARLQQRVPKIRLYLLNALYYDHESRLGALQYMAMAPETLSASEKQELRKVLLDMALYLAQTHVRRGYYYYNSHPGEPLVVHEKLGSYLLALKALGVTSDELPRLAPLLMTQNPMVSHFLREQGLNSESSAWLKWRTTPSHELTMAVDLFRLENLFRNPKTQRSARALHAKIKAHPRYSDYKEYAMRMALLPLQHQPPKQALRQAALLRKEVVNTWSIQDLYRFPEVFAELYIAQGQIYQRLGQDIQATKDFEQANAWFKAMPYARQLEYLSDIKRWYQSRNRDGQAQQIEKLRTEIIQQVKSSYRNDFIGVSKTPYHVYTNSSMGWVMDYTSDTPGKVVMNRILHNARVKRTLPQLWEGFSP